MVSFDYINDIHLDFWVVKDHNSIKEENKIRDFANLLLNKKRSDYLLIGGDIGHFNNQNKIFLDEMSTCYKEIYLVFGNHDLYLISNNQSYKYNRRSFNRIYEMKEWIDNQENINYLDGNIVDVEGIKITGVNMWYDFSYGIKMGKSRQQVLNEWSSLSNDSKKILNVNIENYFNEEKEKLDNVIEESDIIITHVGPDVRLSEYTGKQKIYNSYYFFDGINYIEELENKIWLFGHIHTRKDIIRDGWRIISHAIGYNDENFDLDVKTFNVNKSIKNGGF
jgi:Icc-related predicted phosphoesterase